MSFEGQLGIEQRREEGRYQAEGIIVAPVKVLRKHDIYQKLEAVRYCLWGSKKRSCKTGHRRIKGLNQPC